MQFGGRGSWCRGRGMRCPDMENMMNVASVACVKLLSWGKISAFNIHCYVENVLSVPTLCSF